MGGGGGGGGAVGITLGDDESWNADAQATTKVISRQGLIHRSLHMPF